MLICIWTLIQREAVAAFRICADPLEINKWIYWTMDTRLDKSPKVGFLCLTRAYVCLSENNSCVWKRKKRGDITYIYIYTSICTDIVPEVKSGQPLCMWADAFPSFLTITHQLSSSSNFTTCKFCEVQWLILVNSTCNWNCAVFQGCVTKSCFCSCIVLVSQPLSMHAGLLLCLCSVGERVDVISIHLSKVTYYVYLYLLIYFYDKGKRKLFCSSCPKSSGM